MLESYLPAIPFLTINNEERLKKQVRILEQNESEIDTLRKQVSTMQKKQAEEREEKDEQILDLQTKLSDLKKETDELQKLKTFMDEMEQNLKTNPEMIEIKTDKHGKVKSFEFEGKAVKNTMKSKAVK